MGVFDTNVQLQKYRVLKEVINRAYDGGLETACDEIPEILAPGTDSLVRSSIEKEREIIRERVKIAMGGDKDNPNVVEVIKAACDECPVNEIFVTPACRGCLLHACMDNCPKGAISLVDHKATIDESKCIKCGRCSQVCPYSAILVRKRPCMESCKVKALSADENQKAQIDNDKCISCGACVTKCPFGAIVDKSFVVDIINMIKASENNTKYKVYAVVAPAIASQMAKGRITQMATAIKQLGFYQVVEAATGADVTLYHEANEWAEKKLMTTSCCPSFVMFIEKNFPTLVQYISHSPSPMIETAMMIKRQDSTAKCIFIGPCSSKKKEFQLEKTKGAIDCVMSFEELQAFVDARGIDPSQLEDTPLDNASFYGRIFAKSGGITQGLGEVGATLGITGVVPSVMSGIEECKKSLTLLKMGRAKENFFEGMACIGGCVNGALNITHKPRNVADVDKFGNQATLKTIDNSVNLYRESLKQEQNQE